MIKMAQYEHIRIAYNVYGKSIREIARIYKHSRATVRKALKGIEPGYRRTAEIRYPVLDSYRPFIDEWLKRDKEVHRKQRHTAHRVYTRLVEEQGYSGAESTIRAYVRGKKVELGLAVKEAFIPLDVDIDSGAEIDWGTAEVLLNGQKTKVKIFCMRSKYSGKIFVKIYRNERQEMFFDAHMSGFDYFGGIFRKITYDNLTTAVRKVLKGRKRVENDAFYSFRSYDTFQSIFCAPAKGNEKGGVENLVGYARRNFLVPMPEVDTLDGLNEALLLRCAAHDERPKNNHDQTTIGSLFERERPRMTALPKKGYSNYLISQGKASKEQTLQVDRNHYSVPISYIGMKLDVHVGCHEVRIYKNKKIVATHKRLWGRGGLQLDPFHYLKSLERKPGALDSALPLKKWRETWPADYEEMLKRLRAREEGYGGNREFIKILQLHGSYPDKVVSKAIKTCLTNGACQLESIKQVILKELEQETDYQVEVKTTGLPETPPNSPNLGLYDNLSQGCAA